MVKIAKCSLMMCVFVHNRPIVFIYTCASIIIILSILIQKSVLKLAIAKDLKMLWIS